MDYFLIWNDIKKKKKLRNLLTNPYFTEEIDTLEIINVSLNTTMNEQTILDTFETSYYLEIKIKYSDIFHNLNFIFISSDDGHTTNYFIKPNKSIIENTNFDFDFIQFTKEYFLDFFIEVIDTL